MSRTSAELTIVVPTYNEADNIPELLRSLAQHTPPGTTLIIVDDSPDTRTVDTATDEGHQYSPLLVIKTVHRTVEDRATGLAGAVKEGILLAESTYVIVMDGDLQHPPATIPALLEAAHIYGSDLVVASRYCQGGSATGLGSTFRHAVSQASTFVARGMFPRATRGVTDPMTGFFLIRREALDPGRLQATGFKILLEIMVSHPGLNKAQVPLVFASRLSGTSKGTLAQGMHYLRQLYRLRIQTISQTPFS